MIEVMNEGMGVVVMVAKDLNFVLAEAECWYVFIWMLDEGKLYFLNLSAHNNYLDTHQSNVQAWLANHLAQKNGLNVGRIEAEIAESMDKFILECLSLAAEEY